MYKAAGKFVHLEGQQQAKPVVVFSVQIQANYNLGRGHTFTDLIIPIQEVQVHLATVCM